MTGGEMFKIVGMNGHPYSYCTPSADCGRAEAIVAGPTDPTGPFLN